MIILVIKFLLNQMIMEKYKFLTKYLWKLINLASYDKPFYKLVFSENFKTQIAYLFAKKTQKWLYNKSKIYPKYFLI